MKPKHKLSFNLSVCNTVKDRIFKGAVSEDVPNCSQLLAANRQLNRRSGDANIFRLAEDEGNMALKGKVFEYRGDDGSPIVSWLRKQLRAIELCFDSEFPEAILTVLYSGVDTLGFLGASSSKNNATQETSKTGAMS